MKSLRPAWSVGYGRGDLRGDAVAGLTVAVMLVPQGMAYAMLAGLPPVVGLYASILPLIAYALVGSSRQLAVGPVAMVSLLVGAAVSPLAEPGSAAYLSLAVTLALMVGVVQLGMGLLRLGALVRLLSHPVVSGFTSAAALLIAASQLGHLLGIPLPRSAHIQDLIGPLWAGLGQTHGPTLAVGLGSMALLLVSKRLSPRIPAALVAVVLGSLAVSLGGLSVAVVGTVPSGLPELSLPALERESIASLLPTALVISFIGFMESIAVARSLARRQGERVVANRELVGLGLANLAASVTSGYPVTGGFSRSAVNAQAGARSPVAGGITAFFVAGTVLYLTPAFRFLPTAVLAAIIVVAVLGLVDIAELRTLWTSKRSDAALLLLTFVGTLTLGIEHGIGLGVLVSLAMYLLRAGRPHLAELGRLPDGAWRNVRRFPDAARVEGVRVLRIDSAVWFANVDFLRERLASLEQANGPVRAMVIDASGINALDSTAAAALEELVLDWRRDGRTVVLAQVKGPVRDVLDRSGITDRLGEGAFARTLDAAVAMLRPTLAAVG